MKEEIKQVIKGWYYYDKAFGWAEDEDDFVDSLATRLDKAIGIDAVLLEEIVKQTLQHNINHQLGLMGMSKNVESISLLDSIIQSRPLKCEVGE